MGLEYMESMGLKSVAVKVFCCCRRPFSFLYYGKPIFFFIYNTFKSAATRSLFCIMGKNWASPIFFFNYNTFKRTGSGLAKSNFAHDDGKKFYKSVNISA